jgi:hypothetical protein
MFQAFISLLAVCGAYLGIYRNILQARNRKYRKFQRNIWSGPTLRVNALLLSDDPVPVPVLVLSLPVIPHSEEVTCRPIQSTVSGAPSRHRAMSVACGWSDAAPAASPMCGVNSASRKSADARMAAARAA